MKIDDEEKLINSLNKFVEIINRKLAELSGEDIIPSLPNIDDYSPEARRKQQLKALKRSIKRNRKLSAEDMFNIYFLHKEQGFSFRRIAKQFDVSEWTIRKIFQKVSKVLADLNKSPALIFDDEDE